MVKVGLPSLELAELVGLHRSFGDQISSLSVERPVRAFQSAPAAIGKRDCLRRRPLDNRNELDETRLQFVAEEAIDLQRMVRVGRVDRTQDVGVDLVLLEAIPAADYVVEAAHAAFRDAIGVMHCARPVDADADEIVVLLEEPRPFVVDQRAVGLDRVEHVHARRLIFVRQRDRALEEIHPAQHRLAALPRHLHLRPEGRFHELLDVSFENIVRHQRAFARRIEVFLRQEEAVLATEIAGRARRFCQEVVPGFRRHGLVN
jgi:hypothetical protein